MIEGFSDCEIGDYLDALRRYSKAFSHLPPFRALPPWSTISGFADANTFLCALARSWPLFPASGDLLNLARIFHVNPPIVNPTLTMAIPYGEFPSQW